MDIALYVLAALLVLIGLAGTILPALPGLPVVFAGLLLAAWVDDFVRIGWFTLLILGLLTALALVVDFVATLLGTKKVGASKLAVAGAAVGTLLGLFFGFIGLLVGPFVGALAGELIAGKQLQQAAKAGVGAWLGFLIGSVAKIGLAFTMLGVFALSWWI